MKPLTIKAESVIADYLEENLTGIINIYKGHDKNDVVEFPSLVIESQSSTRHPEMPIETRVFDVAITIEFIGDSETAGTRDLLNELRHEAEYLLEDVEGIQDFANAGSYGFDDRTDQDFHLFDVLIQSNEDQRENTDWVEIISIMVVCQNYDELS